MATGVRGIDAIGDTGDAAAGSGDRTVVQILKQISDNGIPGGAGSGVQYDEDTVHVSGDKLTLAGAVRNDAGTALAADGDRSVLQVDSTGALRVTSAGGGGGGAATIADGADVAEGATTDAAVITDTTGTLSGKLRGLVKWAYERMPASLGQKAMSASLPVVLASDQTSIPVAATLGAETTKVIGTVNQGTNPWVTDTELPAAAALVDAEANPTTPAVGSHLSGFNGTAWDRIRTAAALSDGASVPAAIATALVGREATGNWSRIGSMADADARAIVSNALEVAGLGFGFNGTTWDRLRATIANGLAVDVTRSALPAGAALSATQTDGTQKAITRGGAKGATTAADVTSTSQGADHNALDVADGGGSLTIDNANLDATISSRLKPADTLAAVTSLTQMNGQAIAMGTGARSTGTQRVTVATDDLVPVSDNGGSLTVDAPVGTPAAVRLSDGAAFIDPRDVSDRAAREVGRARIWDGTDEATVLPVRTQPATSEKTIVVTELPNRLATYSAVIATQTPTITIGVKELLAIWSAAANLKDKYIVEIWATGIVTTASTAGRSALRISTITSAPTGGTELTKVDISGAGASDMTNTMQVKTGGGAIGTTFIRKLVWFATQPVARLEVLLFSASNPGNGIILRGGSNAGISIDIEREVAHTAIVDLWTIGVRWLEL